MKYGLLATFATYCVWTFSAHAADVFLKCTVSNPTTHERATTNWKLTDDAAYLNGDRFPGSLEIGDSEIVLTEEFPTLGVSDVTTIDRTTGHYEVTRIRNGRNRINDKITWNGDCTESVAPVQISKPEVPLKLSIIFTDSGVFRVVKITSHDDREIVISRITINRHHNDKCSMTKAFSGLSDNGLNLNELPLSLGKTLTVLANSSCDDPVVVNVETNYGELEADF